MVVSSPATTEARAREGCLGQAPSGAARKARARRERAQARHTIWLVGQFQRVASHHTGCGHKANEESDSSNNTTKMDRLFARIEEVALELEQLKARPTTSTAKEHAAVGGGAAGAAVATTDAKPSDAAAETGGDVHVDTKLPEQLAKPGLSEGNAKEKVELAAWRQEEKQKATSCIDATAPSGNSETTTRGLVVPPSSISSEVKEGRGRATKDLEVQKTEVAGSTGSFAAEGPSEMDLEAKSEKDKKEKDKKTKKGKKKSNPGIDQDKGAEDDFAILSKAMAQAELERQDRGIKAAAVMEVLGHMLQKMPFPGRCDSGCSLTPVNCELEAERSGECIRCGRPTHDVFALAACRQCGVGLCSRCLGQVQLEQRQHPPEGVRSQD